MTCTRYNHGGVAGTSFIAGPLTRGSSDAVGTSLIVDCGGRGIRVSSRTFYVYPAVQPFAPSAGDRRSLPGAAWRRGRAVPGPLMTSPGRSRSSAVRIRASKRLRLFQGTSRDVQHHGWTVRTWNAASGGGF